MRVISDFLQKNSESKPIIHVIGDSVVDEFFHVKITRISPESPSICVMLSQDDDPSESLPGCASNVCYQLKNFNVSSKLFSWLDYDAFDIFKKAGLDCDGIMLEDSLKLPRKKRFFDGDIQVGDRWDVERPYCGISRNDINWYQQHLFDLWKNDHERPDVIILSDYNKGIFDTVKIPYLFSGIRTIVDPKNGPLSKWRGCTIFKPNTVEAQELSGLSDWRSQCDFFQKELECHAVVITQQGLGVVGKNNDYFEYHPSGRVNANRISGAGDCFVGVLALAISHNMSVEEAAIVAFEAGALFVQHQSRSPITPWQLQKKSKFISPKELRNRDFKLIMANGCFDAGLTIGHIECLRYAKSQGDKLVVALNSDDSVKLLKGPTRPFLPLHERMEIVSALQDVDYVVSFNEETPLEIIKQIMPNIIVKGGDYKPEDVAGYGLVDIKIFPYIHGVSTTDKLKLGIMENAKTGDL